MSPQPNACLSCDLSPFCANDQVFTSNAFARNNPGYSLPDSGDLLSAIHHLRDADASQLSLIVIGLSPFNGGQLEPDETSCQLASLAVVAKIEQCLRHHTNSERSTFIGSTAYSGKADNTAMDNKTGCNMSVYRLTSLQLALLSNASGARLDNLCKSVLSSLDQPLYIGDQKLGTRPHIGIAQRRPGLQPESLLRAARSALHACKQQ